MSLLKRLKEVTDGLRNIIVKNPNNALSFPKNGSRRNMNKAVVEYINESSQIVIPPPPKNGSSVGYELAVIATFLIYIKVMFLTDKVSNALLSQEYYIFVIKKLFPILKKLVMIISSLIKNNPTLGYATFTAMSKLTLDAKKSYRKILTNPTAFFSDPAKLIPDARSIRNAAITGAVVGTAMPREITSQITSHLNAVIKSMSASQATVRNNGTRTLFKALMRTPASGMRAVRDNIDDATFVVLVTIASVLFAMSLRAGKSIARRTVNSVIKINGRKTPQLSARRKTVSPVRSIQ